MPPVSEPRRRGVISNPWRERPRRRARGVAPRLSRRVVHATACLSVSDEVVCRMCGEYAPRAGPRSASQSRAHSVSGSGPGSRQVSAPCHAQDLSNFLTRRALARRHVVRVELCSTPCKVLRFAPTPLAHPNAAAALGAPGARGLRTLTASARSSRSGSYVPAGICVLACCARR